MRAGPLRLIDLGGYLAAGMLFSASNAQTAAPAYPSKPVKIIAPVAPSGGVEVARAVAERLSKTLSQPFVVENQSGGGGAIAASMVAKAPANGVGPVIAASGLK